MSVLSIACFLARCWRGARGALLPAVVACAGAQAAEVPLNAMLGERIEFAKNDKLFPVRLQITVFQPEGAGPFPVVVLNHGKNGGNAHLQDRNRAVHATREFLKRGYAVVAPMRQGFAQSGGAAVGEGCNIAGNGDAQAEDVRSVVRWLDTQPWADTGRMLMIGQSHGGLATMAYAQDPQPGFKLFVNFAGGLRYTTGCQWEFALRDAMGRYGKSSRAPSLWFYGENDSLFPPNVAKPAFQAFLDAGGNGEMVAYGPFGVDAHAMFGSADGLDIWLDTVLAKMSESGLPVEIVAPQYGVSPAAPVSSEYARVDDLEALKRVNAGSEESYRKFLAKRLPRAFAIATKLGKQTYAWGGDNPPERALALCKEAHKEDCTIYAVDNTVVWKQP
jgi:dienelactone hydrolase